MLGAGACVQAAGEQGSAASGDGSEGREVGKKPAWLVKLSPGMLLRAVLSPEL